MIHKSISSFFLLPIERQLLNYYLNPTNFIYSAINWSDLYQCHPNYFHFFQSYLEDEINPNLAVQVSNYGLVKYLMEEGYYPSEICYTLAGINNDLLMIQKMNHARVSPDFTFLNEIAKMGNFDCLVYLIDEIGVEVDEKLINYAAFGGDLMTLIYLHKKKRFTHR